MATSSAPLPVLPMSKSAFVEDDPQSPGAASAVVPEDTVMTGVPSGIVVPKDTEIKNGEHDPKSQRNKKRPGWDADSYKTMRRITKLAPDDYYGFLGLKSTCSATEIKDQYKALALLTHPDKNKFPDAKQAFQRVSDAYQVLKDPGHRAEYDRQNGRPYNAPDLEDPSVLFSEEFGDNAFGDDSGSEDDEDGEDSGKTVKVKPNQAHMAIYNSATPFIQKVLASPPMTKEAKDVNLEEVKAINHQIKEQNVKDGLEGDNVLQLYIEYTIFESNAIQAKQYIDKLKENPQDLKAEEWVTYYDSILERAIRTHGYPKSWTLRESAFPKGTDRTSKNGKKGTTRSASSAQDQTGSAPSAQPVVKWAPGLTLAGDKILGVLPRERKVRRMVDGVRGPAETIVFGYQFITRRETENGPTIALESGEEVGNKATAAYFSLPKEEIVDLRYSEERYGQEDAELFDKLLDWASNPFKTRSSDSPRFPNGYGLASFKDGTEDVLSRTALRGMLGRTDADYEIQECEERNGIIPAWTIPPLGSRDPRSLVIEPGKRHRQRLRARETRPIDTWKRYDLREPQKDAQHDQTQTDYEGLFVSEMKKSAGRGRNRAPSRSSRMVDRSVSRSSAQALDEVAKVRDDVARLTAMMEEFMLRGK